MHSKDDRVTDCDLRSSLLNRKSFRYQEGERNFENSEISSVKRRKYSGLAVETRKSSTSKSNNHYFGQCCRTEGCFLSSLNLTDRQLMEFSNNEGHFIYLSPKLDGSTTAYDLEVSKCRNRLSSCTSKLYYTLSQSGLTRFSSHESEFTPLKRWELEYSNFRKIQKIPFFKKYPRWKYFSLWRKKIIRRKFYLARSKLLENLFIFNSFFQNALSMIHNECLSILEMRLLSLQSVHDTSEENYDLSLENVTKRQSEVQHESSEQLRMLSNKILDTVRVSTRRVMEEFLNSNSINTDCGLTFMEKSSLRYEQQKVTRFMRLVDLTVADTLRYIAFESMFEASKIMCSQCSRTNQLVTIVENCTKSALKKGKKTKSDALFKVTVGFGEENQYELSPTRCDVIKTFQKILDAALSVINIPSPVSTAQELRMYMQPEIFDMSVSTALEGISVENRLKLDLRFTSTVDTIFSYIHSSFDGIDVYTDTFTPYWKQFQENRDYILNIDSKFSEISFEMYSSEINRYASMVQIFDSIPTLATVGIVEVDTSFIRSILLPSPSECLFSIQSHIPKLMEKIGTDLLDEVGSIIPVICNSVNSVEEFVRKKKKVLSSLNNMDRYRESQKKCQDLGNLMKESKWTLPDSQIAHLIMISDQLSKLESGIQLAEASEDDDMKHFREKNKDEVPKLKKNIILISEELENPMLSSLDQTPQQALLFLAEKAKIVANYVVHAKTLAEYQTILGQSVDDYEVLDEVQADLNLKIRLWEGVEEWEKLTQEWLSTEFKVIDAFNLEKNVGRYSRLCNQTTKGLPNNRVALKLAEDVQTFSPVLPVVLNLRNDLLRERHWDRIQELIGFQILGQEDLTLGELLNRKVTMYESEIVDIATSAVQESVLEEMMNKVAKRWETCEFEVKLYKDVKGLFILGDVTDVLANLDDSLVTTNTVLSSRYVKGIRPLVDDWRARLLRIQATLDEWLTCQKNWIYLESIFSSPDIIRQLPAAAKMFSLVDKSWRHIMGMANDDPLVMKHGLLQGRKELFESHNVALDKVQKSLEEYLETKRAAFPRFYFLSNDELLEILSQAKDPQAVQPHLRKCFDNLVRLEFDDKGGSVDILAMISAENERVSLGRNLKARGYIEDWLTQVENRMKSSLQGFMKAGLIDYDTKPRSEWVGCHPGQVIATVAQMTWARETERALLHSNAKLAMKDWLKMYIFELTKLIIKIRGPLTDLERKIIVALVTTDVHARDIIENLCENEVDSVQHFTWVQQLRYYWDVETDNCVIRHSDAKMSYGYEYMGATSRLVITPLTDRCWLTLTGSFGLKLGAAPAGPAGTGKTESSKDLAKAIGILCVVFNCSDQIDYLMMGKLFRGLAQGGYWICLDEFNRIDIEVLSVIAQQLLVLREGRLMSKMSINFMGVQIGLKDHHVIITMNPGYAGRTELPDNLQVCFRPVSMMVPNYALIAEIMLFAEGFSDAKTLSRKMCKLYILCSEQLSQQPHYDYGLRAVKSVLVMAGVLKRAYPDIDEDITLIRALVDSNVPKFLSEDLPLFRAIVLDLFPGKSVPKNDYGELSVVLDQQLEKNGLQKVERFSAKIIQLHETFQIRFGAVIVGPAGAGKSTCYKMLASVMSDLRQKNSTNPAFQKVRFEVLNPKCVTMGELYGEFNKLTQEWHDGLASTIMRRAVSDTTSDKKWTVFDGPIDALWIENMNTVLDDNMTLCLANGERIKLKSDMKMLFEVMDLAVASPATVSRIGVVYMTPSDLGWFPYVQSWAGGLKIHECLHIGALKKCILKLFDEFFQQGLDFQRKNCKEPIESVDIQLATSLSYIFQSLLESEKSFLMLSEADFISLVNNIFVFSFVWSVGGGIDENGRESFDTFVRDIFTEKKLPHTGTMYDFFVDPETREFKPWISVVPPYEFQPQASFFELIVPTVETVQYRYLFSNLMNQLKPIFITGVTGTSKTLIMRSLLESLSESDDSTGRMGILHTVVNFSAQTQSLITQLTIESKLEKKRASLLGPPVGRKMLAIFVDDVNMPVMEEYGAQPPVELLRQFLDFKGFYDRGKLFWRDISDTLLLTAAAPPGGGRSKVTPRFTRHFNVFCIPQASPETMSAIYSSMLKGFLDQKFDPDIQKLVQPTVDATIAMYTRISAELLPTPTRFHYTFNMRDISKVFQGILMITCKKCPNPDSFNRLWIHECQRVFYDRLINEEDQKYFQNLIIELQTRFMKLAWPVDKIFDNEKPMIYCDFLRPGAEVKVYEECTDVLKLHKILNDSLYEYNTAFSNQMKLVFFMDAMVHVTRLSRILRQQRGNAMLVGVGGSGKQSLARISSFIAGYECIQIEIIRGYGLNEFRQDIKSMMMKAGIQGKKLSFLFTDTQVINETMMEDINNLLNSGEIPNLFTAEELDKIAESMLPILKEVQIPETRDNCFSHFVNCIRNNLHIVLCNSPVGDTLRIRCRNFPSLINNTTVDWFFSWPESALISVAETFFENLQLPSEEVRTGLVKLCESIHTSVGLAAEKFLAKLRRHVYVTPKSYLDLIGSYTTQLGALMEELEKKAQQMEIGILKLKETNEVVEGLKIELTKLEPVLEEKSKSAAILLKCVEKDKAEAAAVHERVSREEALVGKQTAEVAAIQAEAQADLDVAMPALEKALKALDSLTKADITEVKSFAKPPEAVQTVMEAVCTLFELKPDWDTAKKLLGDSQFLDKLKGYDKDNIKESILKKLKSYISNPTMQIEVVSKVSKAATGLCMFVHAMDVYSRVAKNVAPKQARVEEMTRVLNEANAMLESKRSELEQVNNRVAVLERQCDETMTEKQRLADDTSITAARLDRAEKLTSGLASEGVRWKSSLHELSRQKLDIIGDAFLACACVSYYGPFTGPFRNELIEGWLEIVSRIKIPCSPKFSLVDTLGSSVEVQEWQNMALPTDKMSTDSAILVTKGSRWPLMIDPQNQAHRWIRNFHKQDGIEITTLNNLNLLRVVETCIRMGKPLLIEDVPEYLEPALEPILLKATYQQGNRLLIRVGDNVIDYDKNFKLFMTTKLSNPHYLPETYIKVNIINFTVTMEGLEDQLLGQIVSKERPDVEVRKTELLLCMARDRKQLQELEAKILDLLSKSRGNILDDEELINILADSKVTSLAIKERVQESEKTELEINIARNGYRSAATRGSILYFVIADFSTIDPMYQYSLQYFQSLMRRCIDNSPKSSDLQKRLYDLIAFTTSTVYDNICRGLFEKDKLLFSSLICFQILMHKGMLSQHEWNLFVRGADSTNDSDQNLLNPNPNRLKKSQWDLILAIDALSGKKKLIESIRNSNQEWIAWADSNNPAHQILPHNFDNFLSDFHKVLLIKAYREDQMLAAISVFVSRNLGTKFVTSPSVSMDSIYCDLNNRTPCIFILSKGTDPTGMLFRFADKMGYKSRMSMVSLGQGQGPYAAELIEKGCKTGDWVLLQNCMLAKSWMPALEQIVLSLIENASSNHADFRLFLTSSPVSYFPISVLQNGVKMTNEPPKGVKANVSRAWSSLVKPEQWDTCPKPVEFKKIMVALLFFHANIQERRKFGPLGWNILYAFDESDLQTSISVLNRFLAEDDMIPWDALRFVVGHINYGGRVTDDWDRRCLMSILGIYLNEQIFLENYAFSASGKYFSPPPGSFDAMTQYFSQLPAIDDPEIFGMHPNADVAFYTNESANLMDIVISLQPRDSNSGGGLSNDEIVLAKTAEVEQILPQTLEVEEAGATTFVLQSNGLLGSLAIVLKQEMDKFNRLLTTMQVTIAELKKAIRGLVVMSQDLDKMYTSLLVNRVPSLWTRVSFSSLKSLSSWAVDLVSRVEFIRKWLQHGQPCCFPLPVFFFPQGFMTGTLQTFSRKYQVAIDTLSFQFDILHMEPGKVDTAPEDGVYCHGLWLEGARWDKENWLLQPSFKGEMYTQLPLIHFKPVAGYKPDPRNYLCPTYKTAERKGVLSTTGMSTNFVVTIELPTDVSPDVWVLYGVAALLNLS